MTVLVTITSFVSVHTDLHKNSYSPSTTCGMNYLYGYGAVAFNSYQQFFNVPNLESLAAKLSQNDVPLDFIL